MDYRQHKYASLLVDQEEMNDVMELVVLLLSFIFLVLFSKKSDMVTLKLCFVYFELAPDTQTDLRLCYVRSIV